jgi:hypothetical protein
MGHFAGSKDHFILASNEPTQAIRWNLAPLQNKKV